MKSYQAIGLVCLGAILFYLGGHFRVDVSAQNSPMVAPGGNGEHPFYGVPSGLPQLDQQALIAGNRIIPVTRPLEVPPLYAFDAIIEGGIRQVVVVDSQTKRICVYHIRPGSNRSTIEMVASRNFEWDLRLDDFNNEGITPSQIREQLR